MIRFEDAKREPRPETPPEEHSGSSSSTPPTDEPLDDEKLSPLAPEKDEPTIDNEVGGVLENVKYVARSAKKRLHLDSIHATGPSKLFNPTNVRLHVNWGEDEGSRHGSRDSSDDLSGKPDLRKEATILWRSRDNRKGRNSMSVPLLDPTGPSKYLPQFQIDLKEVGKNILQMCVTFPYWDMAFWSGWSYSIGSVLFVIDGAWAWGPLAFPGTGFEGDELAIGLAFFFGAILYQIGATMAYLEAVNDGSFQGSAMRRLLEGNDEEQKKMLDEKLHTFFGHFVPYRRRKREIKRQEKLADSVDPEAGWKTMERKERPGSIYPPSKEPAPRRGGVDFGEAEEGESSEYMTWRWWPTWHMLKTHHAYEIGYLACAIQLFGATLYGMTGIIALPPIIDSLEEYQENACYWIPQIVASVCFLVASLLFTIETQEKWYKPEITVIGWWIGVWATIGSVGFLLCGAFGPATFNNSGAEYQSSLSSMWGSAAYLISSLFQWYEAINKRPVLELFNEPGEMKSFQVHPI